jgi:putative Mg2+ transporter-C (MgtC) family protein
MLDISGGQGLVQFGELGLAFGLSALIGLEREVKQKAAGLRTHLLVGVGAALIMLVSKYGFSDILARNLIVLDPSRVAAQIVSGIGFLGAGLIIVRRDAIHGLTTAATVWLVAGIGMACAGGLAGLAAAATGLYFVALYGLPAIVRRLPRVGLGPATLRLSYADGRGVLRQVLERCTNAGFSVAQLDIDGNARYPGAVDVLLVVHGRPSPALLAADLEEMDGVLSVTSLDPNAGDG